MSSDLESLLSSMREHGLLLQQDPALPNVAGLVAGGPVRGSWWSHPRAHAIFGAINQLVDHPEVLTVKLVSGKVTFVQRDLWPAVLAVATAREPWQLEHLSDDAAALLDRIDRSEVLIASGPAAKLLERRLLVHGRQVHTESGEHRTELERWHNWAARVGCSMALPVAEGKALIEQRVDALNLKYSGLKYGGRGRLPWR